MVTKDRVDSTSPPLGSRRSFYRPELDALRFFACFAVFVHHVGFTRRIMLASRWLRPMQQAGAFGVCLFFLLSAYLITELLWKEQAETGSIHLQSFYIRRILRIWPLYFGCLLLYGGLVYFVPSFSVSSGRILALVFLVGNWYYAAFGWTNLALDPMWSISVEEQFYLLVPAIAKFGGKRAIWILSLVFLIGSQLALLFLGKRHMLADTTIWTNSVVQFQFFAAGCILALVLQDRKAAWGGGLVRLALFLSGLILWGIAGGPLRLLGRPTEPTVLGLCVGYDLVLVGSVLLFLAVYGISPRWVPRWAIYLGKISFGLYLFHGFILEIAYHTAVAAYIFRLKHYLSFADILIEAGLTIFVASLSYKYFEKPFLRLKDRFTIVRSRPV